MELTSNADEVAGELEAAASELADLEAANAEAGRVALGLVDAETPRRTGTLAAGARSVADPHGWAYVNATPYAGYVDSYQGFASETLRLREDQLVAVYEDHITTALAPLT